MPPELDINKSPNFILIVDEERCHVLQAIWNAVEDGETRGFFKYMARENLMDVYDELMKEISKKEHERGWCKDPECESNQTQND